MKDKYFKITVSTGAVKSDRCTVIGPYRQSDINDFGEPPRGDIEDAIYDLIDSTIEPITKEAAENEGYL